jgi:hypothetical protein
MKVDAPSQSQAVKRLVSALDGHLASSDHANLPRDLPEERTIALVKARMKRG